jgi:hypothetical protein
MARTRSTIRAGSPQEVSSVSRLVQSNRKSRNPKPPRKSIAQEAQRMLELKAQLARQPGTADVRRDDRAPLQTEPVGISPFEDHSPPKPNAELLALVRGKVGVVKELHATLKRKNRESNKENIDAAARPKTFVDPQENAQRVPWHGDSQEAFSDSARDIASSQKRRRIQAQEPHAADEDFQTATPGVADKRRKDLHHKTGQRMTTAQAPTKHFRSEVPGATPSAVSAFDDPDHERDDELGVIPAHHQPALEDAVLRPLRPSQRAPPSAQPHQDPLVSSRNTVALSPTPTPQMTAAEELGIVRQAARKQGMVRQRRPVQSRSAYSAAEEARLIELIEDYGTSYTMLQEEDGRHPDGPLLGQRTQVQLKDKAQELKYQYLK